MTKYIVWNLGLGLGPHKFQMLTYDFASAQNWSFSTSPCSVKIRPNGFGHFSGSWQFYIFLEKVILACWKLRCLFSGKENTKVDVLRYRRHLVGEFEVLHKIEGASWFFDNCFSGFAIGNHIFLFVSESIFLVKFS